MTLKQKRYFWIFVWLLILASGPVSVLRNTSLSLAFEDSLILINFFQRILGLLAFTLLFSQIMLGRFMGKWVQIIGARAYKYHVTGGLITYGIILIHPSMQVLLDYKASGILGAVLALLPGRDIYLNLGKTAFLLLTVGVLAAYFRTKPFFRRHWLKFHILNYVAFAIIAVHSWYLGTDIRTPPFVYVYWIAVFAVSFSVIYRFVLPFVKKYIFRGTSYSKTRSA
jgi:hypothetical protein